VDKVNRPQPDRDAASSAASKPRGAPRLGSNVPDPQGEFPMAAVDYFFYLVFQTARRRDLYLDRRLANLSLSIARWRMLAIIRRIPDCTMSELARYSGIDRTTLTRAVDRLVEAGFVERWSPPRDRRKVSLALSVAGEEAHHRATELLMVENREMTEQFNPEDIRTAARVLQQVLGLMAEPGAANDLINFGPGAP
jgi:DNA-binding MarR family transcriptional regulator